MRKIVLFLSLIISFIFSFLLGTNLFAYLGHYSSLLGRPQMGRLYEPFHLLYWTVTLTTRGPQFKIAYIVTGVLLVILVSICSFFYFRLKVSTTGVFGSARFLRNGELKKTNAFKEGGIILGQSNHARFFQKGEDSFTPWRKGKIIFNDKDAHVFLCAPTRGGKGISVILTSLIADIKNSIIVFDTKKENFNKTSGWRRKFSHVLKFEPCSRDSIHFNPLLEITPGENAYTQASVIVEQITNPDGETSQRTDYWRDQAKVILIGSILFLIENKYKKDGNKDLHLSLNGIIHLLNSPDFDIYEVFQQVMMKADDPNVRLMASEMKNKAPNELSGVLGSANSYLQTFQDPIVAINTEDSDFKLEDIYSSESPVSLYICLNPGQLKANKGLVRIILQLIAIKITESIEPKKHKVVFWLDEFISLGRLAYYEEGLQYFAGYGMRLVFVCQSFQQLYGVYGKETSILANCRYKVILGAGSPEDAKTISELLGTTSYNKETYSTSGSMGSFFAVHKSKSVTEAERKLMNPDDIMRMHYTDFLLIADRLYPYKGKKIISYKDSRFKKYFDLPGAPDSRSAQIRETPSYALKMASRAAPSAPRAIAQLPSRPLQLAAPPDHPSTRYSPFADIAPSESQVAFLAQPPEKGPTLAPSSPSPSPSVTSDVTEETVIENADGFGEDFPDI